MLQRILFVTAVFLVGAFSAQADIIPGQIKTKRAGTLDATLATGIFAGVKQAEVGILFEDGEVGPIRLSLTLPGQEPLLFSIASSEASDCGRRTQAEAVTRDGQKLEAVWDDEFAPTCMRNGRSQWKVEISPEGSSAPVLSLEGQPHSLIVPQIASPDL